MVIKPTETEIREYAEWLGISVSTEPDLLWISKEGLVAPCPWAGSHVRHKMETYITSTLRQERVFGIILVSHSLTKQAHRSMTQTSQAPRL